MPWAALALCVLLAVNPCLARDSGASSESGERGANGAAELALQPAPNFLLITDVAGLGESACAPQAIANRVLFDTIERVRLSTDIDAQLVVVLTTSALACGDIFYVPIANDARGIGYGHQDPRDVFDDSPESSLEGIVFLNDFPYWQSRADEFAYDFNHELGHRWSARVHAIIDGADSDAILGRERQHWSYFLDTQGSPLEGNAWTNLGDRRFSAHTPTAGGVFSSLDLYLMGVLPAADVEPHALLRPEPNDERDCTEQPLSAASPPQSCTPLTVAGDSVPVTIQDIIEAEGERVPAADGEPRDVDVAILVIASGSEPFEASSCEALSTALTQRFSDFERATGGLLRLRNVTRFEAACATWRPIEPGTQSAEQGGCSIVQSRSSSVCYTMALFGMLVLGRCWRNRWFCAARRNARIVLR